MKSLINRYILGKPLELDADSFKDEAVWEKLISLSSKEWKSDFNEQYIIHLLSNFDVDKLVFTNNIYTPIKRSPSKSPMAYESDR